MSTLVLSRVGWGVERFLKLMVMIGLRSVLLVSIR